MGRVATKLKNKYKIKGRFGKLPYSLFVSKHYYSLELSSRAILQGILIQYYGINNGNLSASHSMAKQWGIKSKATLVKGLKELIDKRFIIKTRQGLFLNSEVSCNLFAITWEAIDHIDGLELEIEQTIKPYYTIKQIIEGKDKE
ncbi:hypothetical protein [Entomomonas asaccharolytica]|uniref:Uncharacterized protein n=1 Tax=Entomomonas asaccharolytica TaxID=2785331 RepID=A0A974RWT3_9GAMM|nr:hypothetical protein [Entomomonas asaccharolytica]QQP85536.1 hypothetical protein JHT90_14375 [Entomomonas asaccharolytica]